MTELPVPAPADEVVWLRRRHESDVPAQFRAFSDPGFRRFSDWEPRSEAAALVYLADNERARARGEQIEFALVDPEDDDLLGGASLNSVELAQGRAALGYWLAPHARGRGVATHAVRLIARWAFEDLHLGRLELTCGPDIRASQRVAERCGFAREGVLRSHIPFKGARRDTVVFGLLPGELRSRRLRLRAHMQPSSGRIRRPKITISRREAQAPASAAPDDREDRCAQVRRNVSGAGSPATISPSIPA